MRTARAITKSRSVACGRSAACEITAPDSTKNAITASCEKLAIQVCAGRNPNRRKCSKTTRVAAANRSRSKYSEVASAKSPSPRREGFGLKMRARCSCRCRGVMRRPCEPAQSMLNGGNCQQPRGPPLVAIGVIEHAGEIHLRGVVAGDDSTDERGACNCGTRNIAQCAEEPDDGADQRHDQQTPGHAALRIRGDMRRGGSRALYPGDFRVHVVEYHQVGGQVGSDAKPL